MGSRMSSLQCFFMLSSSVAFWFRHSCSGRNTLSASMTLAQRKQQQSTLGTYISAFLSRQFLWQYMLQVSLSSIADSFARVFLSSGCATSSCRVSFFSLTRKLISALSVSRRVVLCGRGGSTIWSSFFSSVSLWSWAGTVFSSEDMGSPSLKMWAAFPYSSGRTRTLYFQTLTSFSFWRAATWSAERYFYLWYVIQGKAFFRLSMASWERP